ncbi:MAG: hypothetical protein EZS28_053956, partial [Streblomastix strix]
SEVESHCIGLRINPELALSSNKGIGFAPIVGLYYSLQSYPIYSENLLCNQSLLEHVLFVQIDPNVGLSYIDSQDQMLVVVLLSVFQDWIQSKSCPILSESPSFPIVRSVFRKTEDLKK